MTVHSILMVGVGGQGIVLASDVLAAAALTAGFDVKKSEVHGMSQRGGVVSSHVRFGEKVYSPIIPRGEAEIVYSLETMEVLRWADHAAEAAAAVYLDERIRPAAVETYPGNLGEAIRRRFGRVIRLDRADLKHRLGSLRTANIAAVGALSTLLPLPEDAFTTAIRGLVPEGTEEKNLAAFAVGRHQGL